MVLRTTPCQGDKDSGASGIVIDDETVMTVAHAVVEAREVFVRDAALVWWRAEVRHIDRDRDLALLTVPGLRATTMAVASAQKGDAVTMVEGLTTGTATGNVLRRVQINTESIGSDVETKRQGYELSLDVERGDSGAGLVDDQGRLVGVVFAQSNRRASVAWATDLAAVPGVLGGRQALPAPC